MRRAAALLLPLPVLGLLALGTSDAFKHARAQTMPHIMLIVEENLAYGSAAGSPHLIGNPSAPYLNSLASSYVSATQWFSLQHGSQYSYRELISGEPETGLKKPYPGTTLVDELATAGVGWKAYIESAPSTTCTGDSKSGGLYDAGHNPFVEYSSILTTPAQCAEVGPYSQAGLMSDLSGATPPDFVWVTPNLCDDMHTICTGNKVAQGDTWLSTNLPAILGSSWFAANGVVIITWDESVPKDASGGSLGSGGQIPTIVISSGGQGGGAFATPGNHYATLRGIEEAYGIALLGNSANASAGDLLPAFHLAS